MKETYINSSEDHRFEIHPQNPYIRRAPKDLVIMWFPTSLMSILTLAAASPMGSLQRRVNKEVLFGTNQAFTLQPSNSPVVSLWGGVQTYFQGDGNFVV